jgi:hypothetical protein
LLFFPTLFFTIEQNAERPLVGEGPNGRTVADGLEELVGRIVGAGVLVETI